MEKIKMLVYNYRDFDEKQYFDQYADEFGIEIKHVPFSPSMENVSLAEGCQCLNIITTPLTSEMLEKYHALGIRYIVTRTIGYDHIDVETAKRLGICIANTPYGPEGVAEFALMLMLMAIRKARSIEHRFYGQDYTLKGLMGKQLSGMTVGIIGAGSIGMALIKLLEGFKCRVLVYSPSRKAELPSYAEYAQMDEVLSISDIISLHAPSNDKTYHMISKEQINIMKDGVVIVNTARGALLDTNAVIDGLDSGKIAGLGLDVIEDEFDLVYYDHREEVMNKKQLYLLRSYPNVTMTHHMAFYTEQTIETMVRDSLRGAECFFNGKDNPWKVV
ncbi:MAG: NAD(P)-dependent oxidoreductase [Oscillospiraceae bacterium]|nr:NAD(P)-dependent oxidoreductase [Oscillospiraceae bacterium]